MRFHVPIDASVDPTDARCDWLEGIASVGAPAR
jgi:hypothetical protein